MGFLHTYAHTHIHVRANACAHTLQIQDSKHETIKQSPSVMVCSCDPRTQEEDAGNKDDQEFKADINYISLCLTKQARKENPKQNNKATPGNNKECLC